MKNIGKSMAVLTLYCQNPSSFASHLVMCMYTYTLGILNFNNNFLITNKNKSRKIILTEFDCENTEEKHP